MAIEYKAPQKLNQEEVVTGLASEICPDRDVINKEGDGFDFSSKVLATAIVTQLFSSMIEKGIQYGYVFTGETIIFLHIPENPATVYYHVCVPSRDVLPEDNGRVFRTAVAQVFAFLLEALRAKPPPQSWHDAAACLGTWAFEYDALLSRIPETVHQGKESRVSLYKPQPWRGFTQSLTQTRSPRGSAGEREGEATRKSIQDQPYCTHQCLLGLALGNPIDKTCPNAGAHGAKHLDHGEFMRLLLAQLATDRGPDADSQPLGLSGSVGSLFKIRLTARGYTLLAKGVPEQYHPRLQHEDKVYAHLRALQGVHIPVCLGRLDPVLPFYHDGRVYKHLMLLSWGGRPLFRCVDEIEEAVAIDQTTEALAAMHGFGICHRDAEPRNILYDRGGFMLVDFERSEFCSPPGLESVGPDSENRKRKHSKEREGEDAFAKELWSAVRSVSRCFIMKRGASA